MGFKLKRNSLLSLHGQSSSQDGVIDNDVFILTATITGHNMFGKAFPILTEPPEYLFFSWLRSNATLNCTTTTINV